jgi:N12 class adenine-specific DNA methylase
LEMKEREPARHFSDDIREYSNKIVETHSHILTIDSVSLEEILVGELQNFQKLSTQNYTADTDNQLQKTS